MKSDKTNYFNKHSFLLRDISEVEAHPRIRDEAVALRATERAVEFSLKYQRRLHVLHLTTEEETRLLARLPRSHRITAEVSPQHLILNAPECYRKLGTLAQMNPPIRSARHRRSLWKALKAGLIDCIATDHAPHTLAEKNQPYGEAPSGMPGVETSLPLMLDRVNRGECTLEQLRLWMCEMPARIYGMLGKGRIEIGYDADLVLVDLNLKKTVSNSRLSTRSKWSPFDGVELQGWPVRTLVQGHTVFLEGQINTDARGTEIRFA